MTEKLAFGLLFALPLTVQLAVYGYLVGGDALAAAFQQAVTKLACLKEKDTSDLLSRLYGHRLPERLFYAVRLLTALLGGLAAAMMLPKRFGWLAGLLTGAVIYKLFYFYLQYVQSCQLKKLNKLMPYFFKTVICLCYNNPVNNALLKAMDYVPVEFEIAMRQLLNELDADPTSYQPYENFVAKYQHRLNHVDYYFKSMYRIAQTGGSSTGRLLDELNQSISDDINIVRQQKNALVNATISYLGMIPVAILAVALTYLLMSAIDFI